jgi:hypothetical protein
MNTINHTLIVEGKVRNVYVKNVVYNIKVCTFPVKVTQTFSIEREKILKISMILHFPFYQLGRIRASKAFHFSRSLSCIRHMKMSHFPVSSSCDIARSLSLYTVQCRVNYVYHVSIACEPM